MEIVKDRNENETTIRLTGRLDTTTAPQLETMLNEILDDVKNLIMDFENFNCRMTL